ncbi:MAG TPA: phosphotransferase family protein [Chloroflexia bacterium]|nr:phosphotransferase family protein [Chloroflexia bacterium]
MPLSEWEQQFERLAQKIDPQSSLLRAWQLHGGVSARVTALEIMKPGGQVQTMVARQHGETDLKQNPQIAADEFRLLQTLHAAGLAVPAPVYLDRSGEIFGTPCLVIEYIEGQPEFAPANLDELLFQLAEHLAAIHRLDLSKYDLPFLPDMQKRYNQKLAKRPATLDESLDEGRIRDILEAAWPLPQRNKPGLLHGDYWPGNILWQNGKLAAILDWEDAALGDPLADLGNSRLEIAWAFGIEAMHTFTRHYRSITNLDFTSLPYWDLCAALRPASKLSEWAEDSQAEKKLREGHRLFITQAYQVLGL